MNRNLFVIPVMIAFLVVSVMSAAAEMTSSSYRIHSSVLSGGGVFADSTNFFINGTLGQPTPLINPPEPPLSDTYDLHPGFWYIIAAFQSTCPGDFDGDKDVDGADLADYLFDSGGIGLNVFADNFGKNNCP
jgi:hypothetical protein